MAIGQAMCAAWYNGDVVSKTLPDNGEDTCVMAADEAGRNDRVQYLPS
jgi:hypothetical protein